MSSTSQGFWIAADVSPLPTGEAASGKAHIASSTHMYARIEEESLFGVGIGTYAPRLTVLSWPLLLPLELSSVFAGRYLNRRTLNPPLRH